MNYKVFSGKSKCSACNKPIKTIHSVDGVHYGSECAAKLLGKQVLSAPGWLYDLAEQFVVDEAARDAASNQYYYNTGDVQVNFFGWADVSNCTRRDGSSKMWEETIKVCGKNVKVDWQVEIADYLTKRYSELTGRLYDDCNQYVGDVKA